MVRLKGVLFDYGHTLVWFPRYERTRSAAVRNVQKILCRLGVSVETSVIGAVIEKFSHRRDGAVAKIDEEFKEILSILRVEDYSQDDLNEIIQAHWLPYLQDAHVRRGADKLLEHLKTRRFKLGIVANIWSGGMTSVLRKLRLEGFFDVTLASVDVGFQKPDSRIFRLALDCLGLTPEETIMVGDSPSSDIKGAHDVGISTVRLMRGPNRVKPNLVNPDFRIRNLSALLSIIHKQSQRTLSA